MRMDAVAFAKALQNVYNQPQALWPEVQRSLAGLTCGQGRFALCVLGVEPSKHDETRARKIHV